MTYRPQIDKIVTLPTYSHPDAKSDPGEVIQRQHQINIKEKREERKPWQKRNFEVQLLRILRLEGELHNCDD